MERIGSTTPSSGGAGSAPRTIRPRVLLYCDDLAEPVHFPIVLSLAAELKRRRPSAGLLALTNSNQVSAFELPRNLDIVKLPDLGKPDLYGDTAGVRSIRAALIEATINTFAPNVVVILNLPTGINQELARALACLRRATPPVTLILCAIDIVGQPGTLRSSWTRDGTCDVVADTFDRILVFGDPDLCAVAAEEVIPSRVFEKTVYCGDALRHDSETAAVGLDSDGRRCAGDVVIAALGHPPLR